MSKKDRMIAKTHTPGDPGDILYGLLQRRRAMKWPNGGYGPATPLGFGAMGAGGMAGGFGSCDGSAVMSSIKKPIDGESDDNEINYDDEIDFLGKSLKTDENADIVDALTKGAKVIVNNYICNNGKKNDVYIGKTKSKKCCGGDECCHGHHGHHHHDEECDWAEKENRIRKNMEDFMEMIGPDYEDDQELTDAINAAIAAIMEADDMNGTDNVDVRIGSNTSAKEIDTLQRLIDDVKERKVKLEKAVNQGKEDAEKRIENTEGTANVDQNEVTISDIPAGDTADIAAKKKDLEDSLERLGEGSDALNLNENK